jgi:sulfide:quinone oxidoreductase
MARILILGGGFAAIAAAELLSGSADQHQITIVSNNHDFTFLPALVPLVFGDFTADEIHFDMRPKLADRHIRFVEGLVRGVDLHSRVVRIGGDDVEGVIHFDYLLIAMGRRLATEKAPGFFEFAHHLFGIGPALKFKEAISKFRSGSIVVGLCPDAFLPVPVCETALALAAKFKRQIAGGQVSVTAVFPTTLEKAFAGSTLFRDLESEFARKGINLVTDFPIERIDEHSLISRLFSKLDYDLLMLVPPFRGQGSLEHLAPVTDDAGFAQVNELMQVKGFERIYAAGDIVGLPGPRFGYMAMRQAKAAASNILAQLRNEEPTVEYSHKIAWAIGEKYTDPVFFHYGFWDETVEDFDENAIFGMARRIRDHYGALKLGAETAKKTAIAGRKE